MSGSDSQSDEDDWDIDEKSISNTEEEKLANIKEEKTTTPEKTTDILQHVDTIDSSKVNFEKLEKFQWNSIEIKYTNKLVLTVLDTMRRLGQEYANYEVDKHKEHETFMVIGEEIYLEIVRPMLVELGYIDKDIIKEKEEEKDDRNYIIVDGKKCYAYRKHKKKVKKKKKKKKKKKRGMTKEQIIRNNTKDLVKKSLNNIVDMFKKVGLNCEYCFNIKYVELRLATFIHCVNYIINNRINNKQCYELIIGINKALYIVEERKEKLTSKQACKDLRFYRNKLIKYCGFKYENLFVNYPNLILFTKYDKVFPKLIVKPYDCQTELLKSIGDSSLNSKCLIMLNSDIASGKTTAVGAICSYVNCIRTMNKIKKKSKLQVLFVCCMKPVRLQVGRIAYNMNIPFGVATTFEENTVRVINNFNCDKDESRILIIADPNSAICLLKKSQNYILFLDEPTVAADQQNHPITNAFAKIMLLAPEKTVLSSATLPSNNELIDIINYFEKKHLFAKIVNIRSKNSLIGCKMSTFDGIIIMPHNNCKSKDELLFIINKIKTNSFIGRLYTAPNIYKLRQKMLEANIKVIDIESYFSDDINKLCQTHVQKIAIKLLETLANNTNELIEKICKSNQTSLSDSKLNIKKLFTTDAGTFIGHTLVATNDPIKLALEASKELLEGCELASKIIMRYKDNMSTYMKQYEKELNKSKKMSRSGMDKKSKKMSRSDMEKSISQQRMEETIKPRICFLKHLRVNTVYHINKYHNNNKRQIDMSLVPLLLPLDNYVLDLNIPDWIMLLLFAGVGIYDPKNLNKHYTDLVLNMISNKQLSFMFASDEICYGANYPFNNVIIFDDIVLTHSIFTIFQLAGRAGRPGESDRSNVYLDENIATRITNYIKDINKEFVSEEGKNMAIAFQKAIKDMQIKSKEIKKPKIKTKTKIKTKKKEKNLSFYHKPKQKYNRNNYSNRRYNNRNNNSRNTGQYNKPDQTYESFRNVMGSKTNVSNNKTYSFNSRNKQKYTTDGKNENVYVPPSFGGGWSRKNKDKDKNKE